MPGFINHFRKSQTVFSFRALSFKDNPKKRQKANRSNPPPAGHGQVFDILSVNHSNYNSAEVSIF